MEQQQRRVSLGHPLCGTRDCGGKMQHTHDEFALRYQVHRCPRCGATRRISFKHVYRLAQAFAGLAEGAEGQAQP